jgi:hypothetical protein
MSRYKPIDTGMKLLPINLSFQLLPPLRRVSGISIGDGV